MKSLLGLVAFSLACGCTATDPTNREHDRAAIEAALARGVQATRAQDIDAFMALIPEDAIVLTPAGETVSREQLRADVLRDWSVILATLDIQVTVDALEFEGDEATVETWQRWERLMLRPDRSGTDTVLTTQRHRETWRRTPDGWFAFEIQELGGEVFVNGERYDPAGDDATHRTIVANVPVVGLPCEGCEIVFEGLPATLDASARISPVDEPGVPLRIEGVVRDRAGRPAPGVVVYAYHTDARGLYPPEIVDGQRASHRHGRLRGWVRTDAEGRYRFDTIRPAGYPGSAEPQHVHMHVIEPGSCTYYIDDVLFEDDPRLTDEARRRLATGRGGPGIASPARGADGAWVVERDIVLGEAIPGHPGD